jgi:hypothetical protein
VNPLPGGLEGIYSSQILSCCWNGGVEKFFFFTALMRDKYLLHHINKG